MSSYTIPWDADASVIELCDALAAGGLAPGGVVQGDGTVTLTYPADLTVEQRAVAQGIAADLVGARRTHRGGLSLDEYRALKADLAVLRTFRQQSQAQFMALTATQRDRALFDAVNAQTNVLRALLRD